MDLSKLQTREAVLASLRDRLPTAEREVLAALPPSLIPEVEDELAQAVDNGAFVALCVYGPAEAIDERFDFTDIATLVRTWDLPADIIAHVDQEAGLVAPQVVLDDGGDAHGVAYETPMLYNFGFPQFLAQQWAVGEEIHVADPPALPIDCNGSREAVVASTLLLREGHAVGIEAEVREAPASPADDYEPLSGQVVSTRQDFVHPSTSTMYGELTLIVRTDTDRVTMGGVGAYLEDYEGRDIRLVRAE